MALWRYGAPRAVRWAAEQEQGWRRRSAIVLCETCLLSTKLKQTEAYEGYMESNGRPACTTLYPFHPLHRLLYKNTSKSMYPLKST